MDREKTLLEIYRRYSENIKRAGKYQHNYFLADLLILFREQRELTPEEIRSQWERTRAEKKSLYIHVPFCIKKCRYCIYASKKPGKNQISHYISSTLRELEYFKKTIDDFSTLYIGGGTPSILSSENIEKLLKKINRDYSFRERSEKTFEMNPSTTTEDKLKVLKENGINRVSFGVQSTDRDILRNENRGYQTREMALNAVKKAKKRQFEEVNIDLIAGLEGSKTEDIIQSFRELAETGVDTVCIYPLQPDTSYLEKREIEQDKFYRKLGKLMEKLRKPIRKEAEEQGYYIPEMEVNPRDANSWELKRKGHNPSFNNSYRFSGQDIDGCLGIGPESNSYLRNRLDYKRKFMLDFEERKKIYRGQLLDRKDSMRSFILNKAAGDMEVSKKEFRERFSTSIRKEFGENIKKMEKTGVLEDRPEKLEIREKKPEKVFSCFFFLFPEEEILSHIKREAEKHRWDQLYKKIKTLQ